MIVWRLVKKRHARTAFSGVGARLTGGRWNLSGTPLVYTSGALSLAALELFVHLDPEDAPDNLVAIPAELGRLRIRRIEATALSRGFRTHPAPSTLQRIGSEWAKAGREAVLRVPSAAIPEEANYLLNPAHPDFARIAIGKPKRFAFDPRMWK